MLFRTRSFRHVEAILNQPGFLEQYEEVRSVIIGTTEESIIQRHESYGIPDEERTPKSLSVALNNIFKERFMAIGWSEEAPIFQDTAYTGDTWRLDFAKDDLSIEVAFNHASVIAWNLIKPVLASELNHVNKAIQTKIGVLITATNEMKNKGGFDGAIGTFEKYLDYLKPLQNMLTVPLLLIGLEPPQTFEIEHFQLHPRKKIGRIIHY